MQSSESDYPLLNKESNAVTKEKSCGSFSQHASFKFPSVYRRVLSYLVDQVEHGKPNGFSTDGPQKAIILE
jgi:hypothetical protein